MEKSEVLSTERVCPHLTIVVPLYNEEESVPNLLKNIIEAGNDFNFNYEIILIDDGSTDRTWELIEEWKKKLPRLHAIKFRKNYGQTAAMVAGFDHARGKIIVTMDGDLQNDPSDIPKLLKKMEEGYDIVSGWRKDRKDHFSRVFPSRVANAIISFSTGVHLHDYGCSLKAYRADCIKAVKAYGEMHRFFPALASITGAKTTEVPVSHHARKHGVSKYGFDRIFKVFSDIFAMNLITHFSARPLEGFVLCSIPFLLLTIFFGILAILSLYLQWTAGKAMFFTMASALSAAGMFHLVALGILGELVVATSDLSHARLPEITKRIIVQKNGKVLSSHQPTTCKEGSILSKGRGRK